MITHIIVISLQIGLTICCTVYGSFERSDTRWVSCLAGTSCLTIAVCLLQANELGKLLDCSDFKNNTLMSWDLRTEDHLQYLDTADECDFVPKDTHKYDDLTKYNWEKDKTFTITPRGLLLKVVEGCAADEQCIGGMAKIFRSCPHEDMQKFVDCLCCQQIDSDDIKSLTSYIWAHDYRAMNSRSKSNYHWSCEVECKPWWSSRAVQLEDGNRNSKEDPVETEVKIEEIGDGAVDARGTSKRTYTMSATPVRGPSYSATASSRSAVLSTIDMSGNISGAAEVSDSMVAGTMTLNEGPANTASSTHANGSVSHKSFRKAFEFDMLTIMVVATLLWL